MPRIYLSPSTQEGNPYVIGNSEEYYMNLVADAMIPYLRSNGIQYTRNKPNETLGQAIRDSNAGSYDLHLALHSNAAPESLAGKIRGTDVYYYEPSQRSKAAAEMLAENFKKIYPNPEKVRAVPTTTLVELRTTNAPAVLMEIAYHDNPEDAAWIRDNINGIARNIVQGLTEYFQIPFIEAQPARTGTVSTAGGALNIRKRPNVESTVIGSAPNGAKLTVLGQWDEWYVVDYNGLVGYANSRYIRV